MESISLQDLIVRLADMQRDVVVSNSTSMDTNALFTDSRLASNRAGHWAGSEIFFYEPAYTAAANTGVQPFGVTNSVGGQFTLDHTMRPAGTSANLAYAIIRNFGQGTPYRGYVNALKMALDKMGALADSTDSTLLTASGVYEYTIPAGLKTLHTVEIYSGTVYGPWQLRPDQWLLRPGRKLRLTRDVTVAFPWNLTLVGRAAVSLPTALDGTILCDVEEVLEQASEYLNRTSARQNNQQKGANQQQERLRTRRVYSYPNEEEIF